MVADSVSAGLVETGTPQVEILQSEVHLAGQVQVYNALGGDFSEVDLPYFNEPLINASVGPMAASGFDEPAGETANASLSVALDLQDSLDDESGFLQSTQIQFTGDASANVATQAGFLTDVGVGSSGLGDFRATYALTVYQPAQITLTGSASSGCEYLAVQIQKGSFDSELNFIYGEEVFLLDGPLTLNQVLPLVAGQYRIYLSMRVQAGADVISFDPDVFSDSDQASCSGQLHINYQ